MLMELSTAILACVVCLALGVGLSQVITRLIRLARSPQVYRLLRNHFAPTSLATVAVTDRQFPARVRVDLQRSIDRFFLEEATVKHVCGIRDEHMMMFGVGLSELLSQETTAVPVPLDHEEVDIGEDEPVRCQRNALWLLGSGKAKVAVLMSQVVGFHEHPKLRLDVAAENNGDGTAFTREFFKTMEAAVQSAESYRGKVLSLESAEGYTGQSTGITVHRLPVVTRTDVILPEKTLELLERNVVQFIAQRRLLAELGQSARKGLLFHGPPGNGKTHTIRYLIGELTGHTTLLISAEQVGQLGEYMALARLLQPTIVVLEDVDLIAREREHSGSPCQETLLNKLLNEMDGLREDAEIIFLLTTNRPEQLEEALASRPGRVDQVIEFPSPDEGCREKLVRLYSRSLEVSDDVVRATVDRTDGVSAAFIKELMRRALQFHLAHSQDHRIDQADVENALQELLAGGGRLNQRVLGVGYRPGVAERAR
jgi:AAA+ superfamily predicted ATPase